MGYLKAMIKVAIIDDNRLVREGLAALLNQIPDLRAVVSASADAEFLAQAQADVLMLDAGLPDEDSLSVAAAIAKRHTNMKIVMMDLMPANEEIMQFVNAGVAVLMTDEVIDAYPGGHFTHERVSFITDDILAQRYVEIEGRLEKVLSVVKMRGSEHSTDFVTYRLTSAGAVMGESRSVVW